MPQDLATTAPADGQHALVWKALNLLTSTTDRILAELGGDAYPAIDAALAKVEYDLRPVPGDANRAEWEHALDERLRRLAVKVMPTASSAQTAEWRKALVEALSDLPAMVALTAAKRAIHRPFRFIGDIEPAIREIAGEVHQQRAARLASLRRMRAEVERALRPAAALPAAEADAGITPAGIRAMSAEMRRIGLRLGAITEEQVEAAHAST